MMKLLTPCTFTPEQKKRVKLSMISTYHDTKEAYERSIRIGDSTEIRQLRYNLEIDEKILENMKDW